MFDRRHPLGWLFYLLLAVAMSQGQTPGTTTISDIVYRAEGSLAGGTLLISWPTFSTSAGQSVAAGRKCDAGAGRNVVGGAGSKSGGTLLHSGLPT